MEHELIGKKVRITMDGKFKGLTGKVTSAHQAGLYDPNYETFIVKYDGMVEAGLFTVFEFEVIEDETKD